MSRSAKSDIVLIAPLGEPKKRVRLAKTVNIIHQNYSKHIEFWGWKRLKDHNKSEPLEGVSSTRFLMFGGGFENKFARLLYLPFMLNVFFNALIYSPKKVYCLGLETALPVWLASKIRKKIKYVFDDADRLVLIWSLPKKLEQLIVYFEKKVSRDSVAHLVPSMQRYGYETEKQVELNNSPTKSQVQEARAGVETQFVKSLNVYVNGWLGPTRGLLLLDQAAAILEKKEGADIVFNVAVGNLTDTSTDFFNRKNVNHMGSLSHVQSLQQYVTNHIVVTFYDPKIPINQYAIPNKWGDAVAMNCPILLNDGIKTAKPLLDAGAAISTPFDDPHALCKLLCELQRDKYKLAEIKEALKGIAPSYMPFDMAMKPILDNFIQA